MEVSTALAPGTCAAVPAGTGHIEEIQHAQLAGEVRAGAILEHEDSISVSINRLLSDF